MKAILSEMDHASGQQGVQRRGRDSTCARPPPRAPAPLLCLACTAAPAATQLGYAARPPFSD